MRVRQGLEAILLDGGKSWHDGGHREQIILPDVASDGNPRSLDGAILREMRPTPRQGFLYADRACIRFVFPAVELLTPTAGKQKRPIYSIIRRQMLLGAGKTCPSHDTEAHLPGKVCFSEEASSQPTGADARLRWSTHRAKQPIVKFAHVCYDPSGQT